jgi:hypothetical protein
VTATLLDFGDDEHQHVAADAKLVLVVEDVLLDALEVDEGAVGRAQVPQYRVLAEDLDRRVDAGRLGVVVRTLDRGKIWPVEGP